MSESMKVFFQMKCNGRDVAGKPVLKKPIDVRICVQDVDEETMLINSRCPYTTGSHGHHCKASDPEKNKRENRGHCAFVHVLPNSPQAE